MTPSAMPLFDGLIDNFEIQDLPPKPREKVSSLVSRLQEAGQDHEFYPTTNEIIGAVVRDIKSRDRERYRDNASHSFLDIGAGNGKVLHSFAKEFGKASRLFAIEKSDILRGQLDEEVFVVGTEFLEQSLINKTGIDILFCNPPYSEFESWTVKIIREAASPVVYLVIPDRWESKGAIAEAITFRNGEVKIIGQYDFLDSEDRTARARVHLLRISLSKEKDDAFERFFNEQFAELKNKFSANKEEVRQTAKSKFTDLVIGPTYPEALVSLYLQEMEKIQRNYQAVSTLDADLLKELEIHPDKIMEFLKQRLTGCKNLYWQELFDHLEAITSRLTAKSRKSLLATLHDSTSVDFNLGNIYAIILWACRQANTFFDKQLIELFDLMVEKCNVKLYASNKRTWVDERWRYNEEDRANSHYALDYRIVAHRCGGISRSTYSFEKGLEERAAIFLGDILTVANNLGFRSEVEERTPLVNRRDWIDSNKREFYCIHPTTQKRVILFDVRAFRNQNLHIRFNQDFILALNVEHGRLKGWINNGEEAAVELQDPKAAQYFKTNIQLTGGNPALLLC